MGLGGGIGGRTLFYTFVSLVRLILLVAQAEGVGGEGAATEPALGCFTYRGGTGLKSAPP